MSLFLNNVRKIMNGDATAISESLNKPVEDIMDMGICEMILENISECQRIAADSMLDNIRTNDYILETVLKIENASYTESITLTAELDVFNEGIAGSIWKGIKALWQGFVNFLKKLVKRVSFTFAQMSNNGAALVKKYGSEIVNVDGLRISYYPYANFERWTENLDVKVERILQSIYQKYAMIVDEFNGIDYSKADIMDIKAQLGLRAAKAEKMHFDYSQKPTSYNVAGARLSEIVSSLLSLNPLKPGGMEEISAQVRLLARGRATSPVMMDLSPQLMNNIKEILTLEGAYSKDNFTDNMASMASQIEMFTEKSLLALDAAIMATVKGRAAEFGDVHAHIAAAVRPEVQPFALSLAESFKAESTMLFTACNTSLNVIISLMNERHTLAKNAFAEAYKFNLSRKGTKLNESVFAQIDSDVPLDVMMSIL